jgi:hypothetical protein
MPIGEMEESMLFIRTPRPERCGATVYDEPSFPTERSDDSYEQSAVLPDVTRTHAASDDSSSVVLPERSKSLIRAQPVARRLPSLRPMQFSPEDALKTAPVAEDARSGDDMELSSGLGPADSPTSFQSPFAPVPVGPKGLLTSTMVASGQKHKQVEVEDVVPSDRKVAFSRDEDESNGSPPKRPRVETTLKVTRKLHVEEKLPFSRQPLRPRPEVKAEKRVEPRVVRPLALEELSTLEEVSFRGVIPDIRCNFPPLNDFVPLPFAQLSLDDVFENVPKKADVIRETVKKGEEELARRLADFQKKFTDEVCTISSWILEYLSITPYFCLLHTQLTYLYQLPNIHTRLNASQCCSEQKVVRREKKSFILVRPSLVHIVGIDVDYCLIG